jgi:hypothetical protein
MRFPAILLSLTALHSAVLAQTFTSTSVTVGFQPNGIAKGDIDGDADLDAVVAIAGINGRGALMTNNGTGVFVSSNLTVPGGQAVSSVALGDLDNDGDLDAVFSSTTAGLLAIMLNNAGALTGAGTVNTNPNFGERIAIAEVNGDGFNDVVFVDRINSRVRIFLGNGAGGFAVGSVTNVGQLPVDVAVGDFNVDGIVDLATANSGQNSVSVLIGNGTGGFTHTLFAIGLQTHAIGLGDVNNDGNIDIVAASQFNNNFRFLPGNGAGGFGAASVSIAAGGTGPADVQLSDYNEDGNIDVAISFLNSSTLSIVRGNGNGTFQAAITFPGGGSMNLRMFAGDASRDGRQDLALANNSASTVQVLLNNIGVFLNVSVFGTGTPGCYGRLGINTNMAPQVNRPLFRVTTSNAPPLAPGLMFGGTLPDVPGTVISGALWHINFSGVVTNAGITSDESGFSTFSLPIPNDPGLVGAQLTFQAAWLEPPTARCSVPSGGIVTSRGVTITVF